MAQRRKSDSRIKKIGLVTGGGDCPGLNAVIRAVVISSLNRGWEVYGIERGFEGLLHRDRVHRLDTHDVRGIIHTGGTILGTTNRGNPFELNVVEGGKTKHVDVSSEVVKQFHKLGLESLVVIGGDGTLTIADDLAEKGLPVIGVPKTIDNDLMATEMSFGFSTAVTTATDAIDKLHATASSHERVMIVEVMGRYAGWIALYSGVAGGADVILIPERPVDIEEVCAHLRKRHERGKYFSIVVIAEGVRLPEGNASASQVRQSQLRDEFGHVQLGGVSSFLAQEIEARTGFETRVVILGHIQRGGSPTAFDRILATRFGVKAMTLVHQGEFGTMVALHGNQIVTVPLAEASHSPRPVDPELYSTAEVFFG